MLAKEKCDQLKRYSRRDFWINPRKYYVCSYRWDIPICSLIGWYRVKNGRSLMEGVFGKTRVEKNLMFIRGSKIQNMLGEIIMYPYRVAVNGSVQEISHLGYFTQSNLDSQALLTFLYEVLLHANRHLKDPREKEDAIVEYLNYMFHGNKYIISQDYRAKRSDLSEIQKIISERKRILYIEEDEEQSEPFEPYAKI